MLNKGPIIDADSLPDRLSISSCDHLMINLPAEGIDLEEVNKLLIRKAMDLSKNNILKAAKFLGLKRGALRYRLKKYDITGWDEEETKNPAIGPYPRIQLIP